MKALYEWSTTNNSDIPPKLSIDFHGHILKFIDGVGLGVLISYVAPQTMVLSGNRNILLHIDVPYQPFFSHYAITNKVICKTV